MLGAVMQLFKCGSWFRTFITLFGYREWHNVHELCFTCFKVKYKKSYFSKVYKRNVNIIGLDIDFNLEVWGVIVLWEVWTRADFLKLYQVN